MVTSTGHRLASTVFILLLAQYGVAVAQPYDLVLANGRVMDPESGLDAVRSIAIVNGRIAAITEETLQGTQVIDVGGLVVSPGFIDLHAHGQDTFSSSLQALDGVTTALDLEGGAYPVAEWYAEREGVAIINYGVTVSHTGVRRRVLGIDEETHYDAASPEQIEQMRKLLAQGLDEGALGVGFGIQYVPGATREEIFRMFEFVHERNVVSFVHVRGWGLQESGGSVDAVQEMIAAAAASGASVHIVHIGSSGLHSVSVALDMIRGASFRGVDVTTEVYPYTAASTSIEAALFDPGWRERLGADYGDIEWVATGERMSEASFLRRREEGGMVIAHIIPEETVETAIADPIVLIASDGVPFVNGRAHPRGAGTFARVLGRYVRKKGTLTLMDALRKITIMPARRLEASVPQMRTKGRLRVDTDADLTIFDSETVLDRATFPRPSQPSAGIHHVLVEGTFVVRDGQLVEGALPARAIKRR